MLSLTIGRHAMLAEKEEFKATDRDLERQQATSYETSLVSFFVDVCAQGKMAAINYCLFPVDLRRRGFDEIWHNIYPPLASPPSAAASSHQWHIPTSSFPATSISPADAATTDKGRNYLRPIKFTVINEELAHFQLHQLGCRPIAGKIAHGSNELFYHSASHRPILSQLMSPWKTNAFAVTQDTANCHSDSAPRQ